VLDGDPAPPPQKGGRAPQFSAHVYCGQMAGWIKMALSIEVGLGSGHIVLDGNPAPLPKKGAQPPIFGLCLLWLNGWMDQDATWHGGRTRPRRHCVRWRPSSPRYRGTAPQFSANICCGQRADWTKVPLDTEVGRGPVDFVFDGNPAPPQKKGTTTTKFWPMSIVDKRLDA